MDTYSWDNIEIFLISYSSSFHVYIYKDNNQIPQNCVQKWIIFYGDTYHIHNLMSLFDRGTNPMTTKNNEEDESFLK